jgi:hypothetical protein
MTPEAEGIILAILPYANTRAEAVHIAGEALKAGATLDEAHEAVRLWEQLQARSVQRVGEAR